jgi:signal transduction histidine kinase
VPSSVGKVCGVVVPGDGDRLVPDHGRLSQEELERLLAVGRALVAELDLESVLRHLLDTARELTGARYAALGILDESKRELERFLTVGVDEETRRMIGPLPRGHGVLGELIRNPEPLRLHDVTEHPRSYGFPAGHPAMTTFLGAPIVVRGEAYGNLYLTDKSGGEDFTERDERLLVVLSEWAAVAIYNARLYESTEQRRTELERAVRGLEATATIARAVGFETELDRVLELIVKRGRAMSEARVLLVLLEEGESLRLHAAAGEVSGQVVGSTIPVQGTLAGAVMLSGAGQVVPDLSSRVGHGLEQIAGDGRSAIVVPLGFRGRARGVLVALDRMGSDAPFDLNDEHMLSSFAASAAIAIATAQSVGADRLRLSTRASEGERARWARELHDETLQELGALKMMLDSAHQAGEAELMRDTIRRAVAHIDTSILNLQALITELRPAALDEIGLTPALEALISRVGATSGLDIDTQLHLAFPEGRAPTRLDAEIEGTLYRLVQEALSNTVKHASAERVTVELVEADGFVSVEVSDDGSGFDPGRHSEGFGLLGMQERIDLVEGTISIDSSPVSGTTVRARVPARHRAEPPSPHPAVAPRGAAG